MVVLDSDALYQRPAVLVSANDEIINSLFCGLFSDPTEYGNSSVPPACTPEIVTNPVPLIATELSVVSLNTNCLFEVFAVALTPEE